MKTIMNMALVGFMAIAALGSCKDTQSETEVDRTTDVTEMEMETTAADTAVVVEDPDVPGTTSGEMEQVP